MSETPPAYDADNIFAQIIDKKAPCFKVFESKTTLAFLDAYPMAEGHTIVVPKLKGHRDMLTMPVLKTADFLSDVQKVAKAVKDAFGADGVNIWQNNGEASGQTVFHPHFHIVPRKLGDGLHKYPPSAKEELNAEKANPLKAKLEEALNPKRPLRKAKFSKVSDINPDSNGLNLQLKVCGTPEKIESKVGTTWEVVCGDTSGSVVVSFRANQIDDVKKDAVLVFRNANTKMVDSHIRVVVDKWGKISKSEEDLEGEVDMSEKANVSAIEYERVSVN